MTAAARPFWWVRAPLALAGLLPWLVAVAAPKLPAAITALVYAAYGTACHRIPARTLSLWSTPMPVCSRCAGLYLGAAVGALLSWPRLRRRAPTILLGVALALMLADVILQEAGLHPIWHSARIASGMLVGYAAARVFLGRIEGEPAST